MSSKPDKGKFQQGENPTEDKPGQSRKPGQQGDQPGQPKQTDEQQGNENIRGGQQSGQR